MKTKIAALVSFAVSVAATSAAHASNSVMTFEPLATPGQGFTSVLDNAPGNPSLSIYQEAGYQIQTGVIGFGSAHTGDVAPSFVYNGVPMTWYYGSTSLFNDDLSDLSPNTITAVDGSQFNFASIDLAGLNSFYTFTVDGQQGSAPGVDVEFVGHVHGGGSVDSVVHISNEFAFQTFAFQGYTDLDSLTFNVRLPNGPGSGGVGFQFDNITFSSFSQGGGGGGNVPEPASLAILGLGLAGLALSRRK